LFASCNACKDGSGVTAPRATPSCLAIEFIGDRHDIGEAQDGRREDRQYFSQEAGI
jgi:hypothetical protein